MPPPPSFITFILASLILAVTPGPGVLYIVARSATQGRIPGLASAAGVAVGNLVNAVAAALGLAALLAVSALAFTIVKYSGAAFLVCLGVKTLRSTDVTSVKADELPQPIGLTRVGRDGFVVAMLNPKTALFFGAYLPQFLPSSKASTTQTVMLGIIFVLIAASTDTIYALAAGTAKPVFSTWQRGYGLGRTLAGSVYIVLGLGTALTGHRTRS